MDAATFPRLSPAHILECLRQLQVPFSAETLEHPAKGAMAKAYESLAVILGCCSQEELMAGPQFAAMALFDNPELYDDAISERKSFYAV